MPADLLSPARLAELRRLLPAERLESLGHIVRRLVESRSAQPFDAHRYQTAKRAYESAFGAYAEGPENLAALLALAERGAETAADTERLNLVVRIGYLPRFLSKRAKELGITDLGDARQHIDAYMRCNPARARAARSPATRTSEDAND